MKTLNRPMFKNGGPIKEGIMSGMKEPQAINTVLLNSVLIFQYIADNKIFYDLSFL